MTLLEAFRAAYRDKDGSMAIPEVVATGGSISGIGAFMWDCFVRNHNPDLAGFGAFLGACILALGSAQRIRDGLFKDKE